MTIYILADAHIENNREHLRVGDVCEIFCEDTTIKQYIENIALDVKNYEDAGRVIVSVLQLVEMITKMTKRKYPDMTLDIQTMGEVQIIVERKRENEKKWMAALKIIVTGGIVFAGAAFTIATYDQDVNVSGVFARIYELVFGFVPEKGGILEVSYAIGIAVGILMFFNPFTASKKRKEPSPIEIEMEKYETDIQDTIIKISQRQKKSSNS